MKNQIVVISSNKINQSISDGLALLGFTSFKIIPSEKKEFSIEEFSLSLGIIVVSTTDIEDDLEFYEHILYGNEIKNILFDEGDLKINWDAQKWENHLGNKLSTFISDKNNDSDITSHIVDVETIEVESTSPIIKENDTYCEINSELNEIEITPDFNIWQSVNTEESVNISLDNVSLLSTENIEIVNEELPAREENNDTPYLFQIEENNKTLDSDIEEPLLEEKDSYPVGLSWSTLDEINLEEQAALENIQQQINSLANNKKENSNDFIELYPQENHQTMGGGIFIPDDWSLEGQKNDSEPKTSEEDEHTFEPIQFNQSNLIEPAQNNLPTEDFSSVENGATTNSEVVISPYENQEDELIHDDGAVLILGGIGAPGGVASLLAHLDERLPVPVIIKIFLPQGHYDVFTKNMNKRAKMPVKLANENEVLEAGNIWVLPNSLEATFENGQWITLNAQEGESINAAGNTQSAIVVLSGTSENNMFPLMEAFSMNCLILGSLIHESYDPTVIQKMISMGLIQDKFNNLGSHISERWGILRELV